MRVGGRGGGWMTMSSITIAYVKRLVPLKVEKKRKLLFYRLQIQLRNVPSCVRFTYTMYVNHRIEAVSKSLKGMDLNPEQRASMTKFLEEKRKIIQHGELREGDFVKLSELGYGNGGVVLKVEHKPSHIIMARKVSSEEREGEREGGREGEREGGGGIDERE